MTRTMLKSKIHRAHVSAVCLDYEGSISLDARLMAAADILPYEQVQVVNINNGARFTTYAVEATAASGQVCLNGAAARLACPGDIVIILAYAAVEEAEAAQFRPHLVYVDAKNRITRVSALAEALAS